MTLNLKRPQMTSKYHLWLIWLLHQNLPIPTHQIKGSKIVCLPQQCQNIVCNREGCTFFLFYDLIFWTQHKTIFNHHSYLQSGQVWKVQWGFRSSNDFCFRHFIFSIVSYFYAPNFEKVEGAYCFGLVRHSVHLFVPPLQKIKLQFWNFINRFLIKK